MSFYLGVDAGGSKTTALIVDHSGSVMGMGKSGNGNYQFNYNEAERNIREAVLTALSNAGINQQQVTSALFGLAGADRQSDFQVLYAMINKLNLPNYRIVCDTMIAMRAGTNQHFGVVLICGTGVNCAGRNMNGEELQIGGYDYMYGDFGGGKSMAVEVFRAVIRAWDGREQKTSLSQRVLEFLKYPNEEIMFNEFLDQQKTEVPLGVVPILFDCAAEGDEVAQGILTRQGLELGVTAQAMINRLGMNQTAFDVVLAGSLLSKGKGSFMVEPIQNMVLQAAPYARVKRLQMNPVFGAVMGAMDGSGHRVPQRIYNELQKIPN